MVDYYKEVKREILFKSIFKSAEKFSGCGSLWLEFLNMLLRLKIARDFDRRRENWSKCISILKSKLLICSKDKEGLEEAEYSEEFLEKNAFSVKPVKEKKQTKYCKYNLI